MLETPVLFIIFNRLDTAQRVFDEIKKQQPKYLYITADGPRQNKAGETEQCEYIRATILHQIDWPCEVKTLFRTENLGCGKALNSAITWFFDNVEQGIILEDDCLPHPDFFGYCEELLIKYKDTIQVKMIAGCENWETKVQGNVSYCFSKNACVWGWASWRRAWLESNNFTLEGYSLKDLRKGIRPYFSFVKRIWLYRMFFMIKIYVLDKTKVAIDTWDFQLLFMIWKNNGLNIIPAKNLISNIGFGIESTHTGSSENRDANRSTFSILPLVHPASTILTPENKVFWPTYYQFPRNLIKYVLIRIKYYQLKNKGE